MKNCPFCGAVAYHCSRLSDVGFCGNAKVHFMCAKCQVRGPIKDTKEQAIAAWDSREPKGLTP